MKKNTFKRIILQKSEAIRYFGSVGAISEILGTTSPAISKWPSIVPERSAWALWYVAEYVGSDVLSPDLWPGCSDDTLNRLIEHYKHDKLEVKIWK